LAELLGFLEHFRTKDFSRESAAPTAMTEVTSPPLQRGRAAEDHTKILLSVRRCVVELEDGQRQG
jgi:hypothetical protein